MRYNRKEEPINAHTCGLGGFTKKSKKKYAFRSQSDFLKKHITYPGCICFSQLRNIRAELVDPGK